MRTPKYQLIETELREEIVSGRFEPGDRFYSEAELLERYDASSITVVRAIRDLVNMGYLVRSQGKGTFVSRARKRQLVEFTDLEVFSDRDADVEVEVLSLRPGADASTRETLCLAPDEGYHEIIRLRKVEGVPFILQFSHIPSRYIQEEAEPSYYRSIYERLRSDHDLHLYDEEAVEVNDILYPAPGFAAGPLELEGGAPCVRQHKVTTLRNGQVVEDAWGYKRWDYYKFEMATRAGKPLA